MNITKILVPIDFTDNSENAVHAAIKIASLNNASIHLINFCISLSTDGNIPVDTNELLQSRKAQMNQFIQQNCKIFSNRLVTEHNSVEFEHDVVTGMAGDEIPAYIKKNHIDLVIMGRRGEHDALDKFLGSVSTAVIDHAECPVLLIPQQSRFETIRNICFSVGSQSHFKLFMDYVMYWAELFRSSIHFVHVDHLQKDGEQIFDQIRERLKSQNKIPIDYKFANLKGENITQEINQYSEQHSIDLIITIHKKRSLIESLFTKSISVKISHLVKTPLLVIN